MSTQVYLSPIPQGKTVRVASEAPTSAGTTSWTFTTDADAVLISLYVASVSGDLDLELYTQTEEGKDLLIATFPTVSAPTANLLIKKGATIISQLKVVATYTAAATYEIYARGVSAAEASVKVLGATSARASQTNISTSATLAVPAALTDRSGLVIKNNNGLGGASIYIGFSAAEATIANGYPISAQESLGIDIASGVELWAISSAGTTDIRLLESGA